MLYADLKKLIWYIRCADFGIVRKALCKTIAQPTGPDLLRAERCAGDSSSAYENDVSIDRLIHSANKLVKLEILDDERDK